MFMCVRCRERELCFGGVNMKVVQLCPCEDLLNIGLKFVLCCIDVVV